MADVVVLDASAAVELLVGGPRAGRISRRLKGATLTAPAHVDAEVLSALGRLQRGGHLDSATVDELLDSLEQAPVVRVPIAAMLRRAYALRANVALRDALYVVVAADVRGDLVTVDEGLADACRRRQLCRVADL